jgi:hypothetical protein
MNLRETILQEHSKSQTNKIVTWIGNNPVRFDELFHLFLTDEYRVVQRAAWPLSYAALHHPFFIEKQLGKLLKYLKQPNLHDAVKRNTMKILQAIHIPKKYHGLVMDTCFTYISSPNEKAAVKAFSLTILHQLSALYPEIRQELKTIIEDRWNFETPAFKARAKKIINESGTTFR